MSRSEERRLMTIVIANQTHLFNFGGLTHFEISAHDFDSLKREADEGNAKAQYEYAMHLSTGDGGPDEMREAARYFKLSADQRFGQGQYC
jgi:TPR repeat protein